ncbi:hypothetical protein D3C75_667920 [compost metagenome]
MGIRLALVLERTEAGDSVNRNVAEQLVPRLQIMHIACRNDRLVHLLADFTNLAYNIAQILGAGYKSFINQMHIHR